MRAATIERPAFSKRRQTSPMRLPLTPSGLTMDRVRSSAIRFDLSVNADEWEIFRRRKRRPPADYPTTLRLPRPTSLHGSARRAISGGPRASGTVYLGYHARANLALGGSARLIRSFWGRRGGWRDAAGFSRPKDQTEKLSPQPHSPLTFGFLKRNASFRPCLTKSTTVPSINARLAVSTNTRTPRSSKIESPGCGPSA